MADQPPRSSQQRDSSVPDLSITALDTPETVKPGEGFTAIAVVSFRRREPPRYTQQVIFEVNGVEIAEAPTDGEGRASVDHVFDAAGTYRFAAQIRGFSGSRVRRLIRVDTGASTSKPLGQPVANAAGSKGKYLVSVCVPHDDSSPAKDVPVRLIVAKLGAGPEIVDLKTDGNGFAVDADTDLPYRLEFTEPRCSVTVQAAGREIALKNLAGPPPGASTADGTPAMVAGSPTPSADTAKLKADSRERVRSAGEKFADEFFDALLGPAPAVTVRPEPRRWWRFFRRRAS